MSKFARVLDFRLTAGGSFPLLVEGEYVRIMTSTGPVEIQADDYDLGPLSPGQGMEGSPYRRLLIVDRSGAPNIGTVLIASSGFIDQRINGDVSIIDGEKSRTLAGGMFAGVPICANGGANFSNTQVWNPAGSGKNLIINAATSALYGGAGAVNYCFSTVMLNTAATNAVANKKAGAAGSVAQLRRELTVGVGSTGLSILRNETLPSTTSLQWNVRGALVVPPGYGLQVASEVSNFSLNTSVEWFEEAV